MSEIPCAAASPLPTTRDIERLAAEVPALRSESVSLPPDLPASPRDNADVPKLEEPELISAEELLSRVMAVRLKINGEEQRVGVSDIRIMARERQAAYEKMSQKIQEAIDRQREVEKPADWWSWMAKTVVKVLTVVVSALSVVTAAVSSGLLGFIAVGSLLATCVLSGLYLKKELLDAKGSDEFNCLAAALTIAAALPAARRAISVGKIDELIAESVSDVGAASARKIRVDLQRMQEDEMDRLRQMIEDAEDSTQRIIRIFKAQEDSLSNNACHVA